MSWQFSILVRNARLDAFESTVGASAIMEVRTGGQPANCAAASTGSVLATIALPANWMDAAAAGTKAKAGTWQDLSADATGTAAHCRVYANDGTTCHGQGSVTATGGGGDVTFATVSFVAGAEITITSFSITDGNA